jgi:hypothetical protein
MRATDLELQEARRILASIRILTVAGSTGKSRGELSTYFAHDSVNPVFFFACLNDFC